MRSRNTQQTPHKLSRTDSTNMKYIYIIKQNKYYGVHNWKIYVIRVFFCVPFHQTQKNGYFFSVIVKKNLQTNHQTINFLQFQTCGSQLILTEEM